MRKFTSEELARSAIIANASYYMGTKEGSDEHHRIIDSYNNVAPNPRGYKVKYTDAWCATFVTFVFDKTGLSDLIVRECGCQEMINKMKTKGLIDSAKKTTNFVKGNIVFYDWDSNGRSDHVGIIKTVNIKSNVLTVIEGNKNDEVGLRTLPINSFTISCIGIPNWKACIDTSAYYEKIGWNKDVKGWWYAYGHDKGEYYRNTVKKIGDRLFCFDSDGYLVDMSQSTYAQDGGIEEIKGKYLAL